MIEEFTKKLLLELCLDPRIEDGMFSVDKKDHIEILRDHLYDEGFCVEFVSEYINNLIEGKYPERQAYTKTGYLATFDTIQGKKEAMGAGTHFDKNPVHKRKDPTHKDKEKDEDEPKSPKKDVKVKEKDTEKEVPEKKKDSDDKEETKKKPTKKSDSKDKKKDGDEEDKDEGETSTLNFGKAKEKETPEEEKPRKEEWKETPDDTRRRAEALGWEKDTSGNWYCDTEFVGITSDDDYVVPIKDGDKNIPTEWPTHVCVKKDEEK